MSSDFQDWTELERAVETICRNPSELASDLAERAATALRNIVANRLVREAYAFSPENLLNGLFEIRDGLSNGHQTVENGILQALCSPSARGVEATLSSNLQSLSLEGKPWYIDDTVLYGEDHLNKSEGAFGAVSIVKWREKTCASKKVSAQGSNLNAKEDFVKEMDLLWAVRRHENFVDCYGGYWEEKPGEVGNGYMIMELVDRGLNLEQLVNTEHDVLTLQHKMQILYGISSAMAYCVRCDPIIIHGDLHPKNVLIVEQADAHGQSKLYIPKICDFGMGLMIKDSHGRRELARIGARQCDGRQGYCSPEKFKSKIATEKLDVWGFGWIAYFLFTLRHPGKNMELEDIQVQTVLQQASKSIPTHVMNIIRECIVTNESQRTSFGEITAKLRSFLPLMDTTVTSTITTSPAASSLDLPLYHNDNASVSWRTMPSVSSGSADEVDSRVLEGDRYYNAKDISRAKQIYEQLAVEEVPSAMHRLSKLYRESGKYPPEVSLEFTRRAAARGHIASMWRLGHSYEYGIGTRKNRAETVFWYKKAAEHGHTMAQVNYAQCVLRGDDGGREDKAEIANHLRTASIAGNAEAMYMYGLCLKNGDGVKQDSKAALSYFRQAAHNMHPRAMLEYGSWLIHGWGGQKKNPKEGTYWIELYSQSKQPYSRRGSNTSPI